MTDKKSHIAIVLDTRNELNKVSPTFCLAKWLQVTVHLATGRTHSCHHTNTHTVPLEELARDVSSLHNTEQKAEERRAMHRGEQIPGCNYCWRIENLGANKISDRLFKSADPWAGRSGLAKVTAAIDQESWKIQPTYLELDVGHTCNMACVYCSPEYSSKWVEDIDRHGPYKYGRQSWNSLEELKRLGRFPIYAAKDVNPYEEAFIKWWPEVSKELHTFRITGGEPLLNKTTWSLIKALIEEPKPHIDFAINTNLMAPDKVISNLIDSINSLKDKVRSIHIFSSMEAVGEHAELIRWGLDWSVFDKNVKRVLTETTADVTIMTTVNALCYWTFEDFCTYIGGLRAVYSRSRISASFNFLRDPPWLTLQVMNDSARSNFASTCRKIANADNTDSTGVGLFSVNMKERLRNLAAFCEGPRSLDYIGLKPYIEQLAARRSPRYLGIPLQDIL